MFKCYFVQNLPSANAILAQWHFDAIVLHANGFGELLAEILDGLSQQSAAPVLLVLDSADEGQQIEALECGAAEIAVEPVSGRLLCAKLTRLIEISQPRQGAKPKLIQFGPLRLDPRRAMATVNGNRLPLTPGEFELLVLLASRAEEFVDRDTIARTLAGSSDLESRRSADMHVCRIRRKLREAGARRVLLETVYGRGYMLQLEALEDASMAAVPAAPEWTV